MDGSTRTFSDLIFSVGRVQQNAERKVLMVKKPVEAREASRSLSVRPSPMLWLDLENESLPETLGSKRISTPVTEYLFIKKLAGARGYVDVEYLEAYIELGYFQGANKNNLILVEQNEVLNKGKLRYRDEILRHKAVDLLGDMVLADAPVMGHFIGRGADHSLHHLLMLELMCDPTNYVITTLREFEQQWLSLTDDECDSRCNTI